MKIMILNWKDIRHPEVGGAEIIVYEMAKRLASEGHEVLWFCRSFKNGPKEEIIDGIKIVRHGNLFSTYLFAPIYYWSLPKKPDLILDISNTIFWQSPIWGWKSKKVAYLNQLAQDVFYYEFPILISRLGMIIERLQYLTYKNTKFVCYANSTVDDLVSMGVDRKNIKTFTLGLDRDRYAPGVKSKTPLLICVNRLVRMKRTDLAIKAMKEVSKVVPEAKLVIVGTGYARKELEVLRDKLGLNGCVEFADENTWYFQKNSKDFKVKLMQKAWALIFPSVKEGWGMTVTECNSCQTPAIGTNVTGLRDSIIDGKTGILVSDSPTVSELAAAILKLLLDRKLRDKLALNAYKFSTGFSWEKSYREFKEVVTG